MKSIFTKYAGPTNHRGSRIIAKDMDGNRVTVSYDAALSSEQNHRMAAITLHAKMGWTGQVVGGQYKDGYHWVFIPFSFLDEMGLGALQDANIELQRLHTHTRETCPEHCPTYSAIQKTQLAIVNLLNLK